MNAQFPQGDTAESIEGTAAHWVLSEMLEGRIHPEGSPAPNSVTITGEMLDGAELARDTVIERIGTTAGLVVEETVSIPSIHPDCFGTPDLWTYQISNCHLEVFDYKFGHGFVDEYYNPQGLLYVLGILERLKSQIINPLLVTVSFTIIQPRCFYRGAPVRTHNYTVRDAAVYIDALEAAAQDAMAPNPIATTGPQCDHCPGRHACDALQLAGYQAAAIASDRQPHNLTPQAAALELRMLERALSNLEARVEGLRELTLANMRAGARIPYYRLESGRGRQQWNITPQELITIGAMLGKDLSKPGVVTPSQAKKLGVDASVINAYSANTPGALKLIPENNAEAAKVFG